MQQQDSTMMPPPPSYTRHQGPTANPPTSLPSEEQPRDSTQVLNAPTQPPAATSFYAPDRPPSPSPSTATSLPPYETVTYKGFPSEAAYMTALKEWAEEKKFIQPSEDAQTVSGFYGSKTLDEYGGDRSGKPKIDGEEKKSFWRRRRESKGV